MPAALSPGFPAALRAVHGHGFYKAGTRQFGLEYRKHVNDLPQPPAPSSAVCALPGGCFAAPVLTQFVRGESLPGPQVQTDDELLDYARRNGSTGDHANCT